MRQTACGTEQRGKQAGWLATQPTRFASKVSMELTRSHEMVLVLSNQHFLTKLLHLFRLGNVFNEISYIYSNLHKF